MLPRLANNICSPPFPNFADMLPLRVGTGTNNYAKLKRFSSSTANSIYSGAEKMRENLI
jgi:hypothetical protein